MVEGTEDTGFLSLDAAGTAIEGLLAEERKAPAKESGATREVRFKARVKAKAKPEERTDEPIPITAEDGTEDAATERAREDAAEAAEEAKPESADAKATEEAEEEKGEEEEEEEKKPAPRMLTVKVDGQEIEVDEEEVRKGYSRTADYTRKTQALAAEKTRFEAEEVAAVRAERAQYAERLAALAAIVQLPGEEPNWDDLRERLSPEDFTTQFADWRKAQKRVEDVRAEQERVFALHEADEEKRLAATLKEENDKLGEVFPEWKDPVKGKTMKDDLIAYAKSLGFRDEDIAQVADHRLLVMLEHARRYTESQKRKPKIEEKIDRALETMKPSSTPSKPKSADIERAKARLAQSGRVEDAADVIAKMKLV